MTEDDLRSEYSFNYARAKPNRFAANMPLSEFNEFGDLPEGIYSATLEEVVIRFGGQSIQRIAVTDRLRAIHDLARASGGLDRMIIFGSYVSAKVDPNDVDILLVMRDDFVLDQCPPEAHVLFDHKRADRELGASIFWIRPGMLLGMTLDRFINQWQTKRDGNRRGIIEVRI